MPLSQVIAACLLSCIVLASDGCRPADPLVEIRRLQQSGEAAASVEPLRALLDERRGDPEVLYLYARALIAAQQPTLADWALRQAMEDPEWLVPAGLDLASASLATRDYPMAIEAADRVIAAHPENVQARLLRANALVRSKRFYEETLAEVDRIYELDPDNLDVLEPRILALLGLEREEEAAAAIEDLGRQIDSRELGNDIPAWYCATTALFADESGHAELADERWQHCLELAPAYPNVVTNAIAFYDARGDFDRSLEILRNASREAPGSREFRLGLSQRLLDRGQRAEAEAVLREATEVEQPLQAATAWVDLGKHLQEVDDFAAAARAMDRAVELVRSVQEPGAQLLLEQADALVLAGEFDRALAIADDMSLDTHREMIRARVAQERGQPAEALEHFDAAFLLWPDNPWARYSAALAAEAVGDFDRAIDEYRNVIRIGLSGTDARIRLSRLHLAEGKTVLALALLLERTDVAPLDRAEMLLQIRILAELGEDARLAAALEAIHQTRPGQLGHAFAAAAEGMRARAGAAAAVAQLRKWESHELLDFGAPNGFDALRALVRLSSDAGRATEAEATVRAALREHPDSAEAHEILGLQLELSGAAPDAARGEYQRALELDAGNALALAGLGRLALDANPAQALEFFDRAATANPFDPEAPRFAARALVAMGDPLAAEERLDALLGNHPYDADAAAELVALQLARGHVTDHTLERAERAARFGGGASALDLLSRVHQLRNEPELARAAAERAQALRAPRSG